MEEDKQYRSAQAAALRFLLSRPRTRREVTERLRQKGHNDDIISQVVGRLQELGYVNDADFARRWLDGEIARKPQGRLGLRRKLLDRGVDPDVAAAALTAAFDRPAELAAARAAARKKLPLLTEDDREKLRGKLGQHLQRRGFAYPVIVQVLDDILNSDAE